LAGINRQVNLYSWRVEHFLGALAILVVLYFSWQPNRQVNDSWRLAAKLMEFSWRSILGGFCLAASRQESFPWRFWYFSWQYLSAKAITVWGSSVLASHASMDARDGRW